MNAVMYGNDIYAAGKSLYSSPNKMTGTCWRYPIDLR
jgi:hypothetical protein